MVAEPAVTAVARPLLLIVATPVLDELQVTCVVISRLVPSEYVQVAVSCWVFPTTLLAVAGVTDTEDKVAAVTVRVVVSVTVPLVAVMVVVPAATAVSRPLPLTVATDGLDEVQVTCVDISRLVPSEYEPVAANCWVLPAGALGVSGVTDTEDKVAAVTVRVAVPVLPLKVAVMVAVPAATPVARPLLLTVATVALDELQVTTVVISRLAPSENMPAAANCVVAPAGMLGLEGVTDMKTSVTPGGNVAAESELPPPPHPANRRNIARSGITSVNKHLSLRLFILLPPVYWPFENGIMDSRINDLSPFTLIPRCNFTAMVYITRELFLMRLSL